MEPKAIVKFEQAMTPDFPLAIMRAEGRIRSPQVFHWHDYLELNWVNHGRGVNYIADREYAFEPGQLFLINNIDRHIAVTDGSLDMCIVVFDPTLLWEAPLARQEYLSVFYPVGPSASNLVSLGEQERARVRALFAEMEAEWAQKKRGYEMMLRAKLMELLATLYRVLPEGRDAEAVRLLRKNYAKIRPAMEYMQNRFREALSLETLASACGMSRTYFCTVFRQTVGVHSAAYLERVRVRHACLLLATTSLPVVEISLESGFSSLSNFNAAFKKSCGITPSQYRNTHMI